MKYILFVLLVALYSLPALAEEQVADKITCSAVLVNYDGIKGRDFEEAKKLIDKRDGIIGEYVKQQKIKEPKIQSQNFDIVSSQNAEPANNTYDISGNIVYGFDDFDVAMKFSEFLVSQNIQTSLIYSTTEKGVCNNFPNEAERGC